jgi:hypothetical protein
MQSESTDKFQREKVNGTTTRVTPPTPSFTWPLATTKPREPARWRPPAPPAQLAPLPRVARASVPPPIVEPARPVEPVQPVHIERVQPEPVRVEPVQRAPVRVEPVLPEPVRVDPVQPEPVSVEPVQRAPIRVEPVRVEPARVEAVRVEAAARDFVPEAPIAFGASMLQARTRRSKAAAVYVPPVADDSIGSSTFGAGVLQARRGTNKLFVIAMLLAVLAVVALILR